MFYILKLCFGSIYLTECYRQCCGLPLSFSYFFKQSRKILFERVRWTRQSRGVFRLGTQDVTMRWET